jgi:hypothetical protein
VTIERDETTATKLASVSQRLEAVEVRDASITCAHKNAHRALSDLEDLNERVMALAEAVGDVDRVTETALGELIAVAGKTATDVTELAKVTADELAGERRKREALERAIVSTEGGKVRPTHRGAQSQGRDQDCWRAMPRFARIGMTRTSWPPRPPGLWKRYQAFIQGRRSCGAG